MSELRKYYKNKIVPSLHKHFAYKSVMQVPKIEKIVLNMGVGDATKDVKFLESAIDEMTRISGQKPVVTKAKESVANFKLRKGQSIGVKVTLRGEKMWAFLEKLINIAMPRVRDFRGLSMKSFDSTGNYSIGIKEQIIFPEIVYDNIKKVRGFDITIVTNTNNNEHSAMLLKMLGMPLNMSKQN